MQKIVPHLWFDKEAREAAEFYASVFDQSRVLDSTVIRDTPSGDTEVVAFELEGMRFSAISAGPYFRIQPIHIANGELRLRGGGRHEVESAVSRWDRVDASG